MSGLTAVDGHTRYHHQMHSIVATTKNGRHDVHPCMEQIHKFLRIRPKKKERTFFYKKKEVRYTYADVKLIKQAQRNVCLRKINLCSRASLKYSAVKEEPLKETRCGRKAKQKGDVRRKKSRTRHRPLSMDRIVDVLWKDTGLREHRVTVNNIPDEDVFTENDLAEIIRQRDEKYTVAEMRIRLPRMHKMEVLDMHLSLVYEIGQANGLSDVSGFSIDRLNMNVWSADGLLVYDAGSFCLMDTYTDRTGIRTVHRDIVFYEKDDVLRCMNTTDGSDTVVDMAVDNLDIVMHSSGVCTDGQSEGVVVYTKDNVLHINGTAKQRFKQTVHLVRVVGPYVLATSSNTFSVFIGQRRILRYSRGTAFSTVAGRAMAGGVMAVLCDVGGSILVLMHLDGVLFEKKMFCGEMVEFVSLHRSMAYFCVGMADEAVVYRYSIPGGDMAEIQTRVVRRIPGRHRQAVFDDELLWLYMLDHGSTVRMYS